MASVSDISQYLADIFPGYVRHITRIARGATWKQPAHVSVGSVASGDKRARDLCRPGRRQTRGGTGVADLNGLPVSFRTDPAIVSMAD
jgi:hypothetical protein